MGSRSRKALIQGAMWRPTTPCLLMALRHVASTWLEAMNSGEQFTTSTSWRKHTHIIWTVRYMLSILIRERNNANTSCYSCIHTSSNHSQLLHLVIIEFVLWWLILVKSRGTSYLRPIGADGHAHIWDPDNVLNGTWSGNNSLKHRSVLLKSELTSESEKPQFGSNKCWWTFLCYFLN